MAFLRGGVEIFRFRSSKLRQKEERSSLISKTAQKASEEGTVNYV